MTLGILAALDNFIIIVPTDGILISSSMILPRKWWIFAVALGIGSTLGAIGLAHLVELFGTDIIQRIFPDLLASDAYLTTQKFFQEYGLLVVFAVAITPLIQQPAVILAALAKTPLLQIFLVVLVGRILKFLFMAYLGSHFPRLLKKLWGVQSELEEVGAISEAKPGK